MKTRQAELLLAGVIVARATSLLFSKVSLRSIGPFQLMGLRFALAFLVLLLLFGRKKLTGLKPRTLWRGFLLGAAFFAVMTAELFGLRETDSSTTSFLENTAIVWVPFLSAALHRARPGRRDVLCALLALALVCSCFGFTLQPVAQRYVSAKKAGLFCALNPLTAAVLGAVFLGERLGAAGLAGAALIAAGFILQSLPEKKQSDAGG